MSGKKHNTLEIPTETLRDYFAAQVLNGMWASGDEFSIVPGQNYDFSLALHAYKAADAMLEVRTLNINRHFPKKDDS